MRGRIRQEKRAAPTITGSFKNDQMGASFTHIPCSINENLKPFEFLPVRTPAPRASAPGSWLWPPPFGVYLLEFSRPRGGLAGSSRAFGRLKMWPSVEPSARLPRAATCHGERHAEGQWTRNSRGFKQRTLYRVYKNIKRILRENAEQVAMGLTLE